MNKAKIILSVLGVLVVVGSVLAFKTHESYLGNLRCTNFTIPVTTTVTLPASECPFTAYTVNINGPIRYCTLISNPTAPCIATRRVLVHP